MRVLIVCTANHYRSPMAEFLLRHACQARDLDWDVSSAGTHALTGSQMHAGTRRLLEHRGIEVHEWHARRVDAAIVEDAEIILTATRVHRALLVSARAELLAKTFPILRFARMAEDARISHRWSPHRDSAEVMIEAVARAEVAGGATDDLADPMGKSHRALRRCASSLDGAIDQMLG